MKVSKLQRRCNYLLLTFVFAFQMLDNLIRQQGWSIRGFSIIKNSILMVCVLCLLLETYLLCYKNKKLLYVDEIFSITKLSIVLILTSVYFILKNNEFHLITIESVVRIIIPAVVAFAVINVMEERDIYQIMCFVLIISFIGYLLSIWDKFTLSNILSISFLNSNSPFESTFFSPASISFCLFFGYYRKNKIYMILSAIFTIMTFKRIMVLYAAFLFLFGGIISKRREVPKWLILMFKLSFLGVSYFYIQLLKGNIADIVYKWLGISVNNFTMGRAWLMNNIIYHNFQSTGLGTSRLEYRSMEMDIPEIYVELGAIAVIAVVWFITDIAKYNWYNLVIVIFCLLEILTSHWLDIMYFWIVADITIGCIAYKDMDKYSQSTKRIRLKITKKHSFSI